MNVSPGRPFHIIVSNFSNRKVYLNHNNMMITHTANPHIVTHTVDTVDRNTAPIEIAKTDFNSIALEVEQS